MGHAEVPFDPALDVAALIVTDKNELVVAEPGEPAAHRRVVTAEPVAG